MTTVPLNRPVHQATAIPATMRSVTQTQYGSSPEDVLRLDDVPLPVIRDNEVLVEVRAASLDRGTWHLMSGLQYPIRLGAGLVRPKALNPGRSLAGMVVAVGKDVTEFHVGDEVYGFANAAFAQYASASVKKIALKPTTRARPRPSRSSRCCASPRTSPSRRPPQLPCPG